MSQAIVCHPRLAMWGREAWCVCLNWSSLDGGGSVVTVVGWGVCRLGAPHGPYWSALCLVSRVVVLVLTQMFRRISQFHNHFLERFSLVSVDTEWIAERRTDTLYLLGGGLTESSSPHGGRARFASLRT